MLLLEKYSILSVILSCCFSVFTDLVKDTECRLAKQKT